MDSSRLAGKLDSGHDSGDLICTYIAIRGTDQYFDVTKYGYNTIEADDGGNYWKTDHDKPHVYTDSYKPGVTPDEFAEVLDSILAKGPGAKCSE